MLSMFIGIVVLAFVTQADEGDDELMKRALTSYDLPDAELDDSAFAKAWQFGTGRPWHAEFQNTWSKFQRRPLPLEGQQIQPHTAHMPVQQLPVNHVSPYSVPVPVHLKKHRNFKQIVTPWTPHVIFPYAIPEELKSRAMAYSSRGGGHHQKMVHRRRFPWSSTYPRITHSDHTIIKNQIMDDDEDSEMLEEAAAAAAEAAKRVLDQGGAAGPALAADAAERASEAAKARVRARRAVWAAARANTSDGFH
jgi:hypothetical protein